MFLSFFPAGLFLGDLNQIEKLNYYQFGGWKKLIFHIAKHKNLQEIEQLGTPKPPKVGEESAMNLSRQVSMQFIESTEDEDFIKPDSYLWL